MAAAHRHAADCRQSSLGRRSRLGRLFRDHGSVLETLIQQPQLIGRRAKDRPAMVVGFAAESEKLVENAQAKLTAKNCNMMVANEVSGASGVFGGENNKVLILTKKGKESWPWLTKQEVARRLVARLAAMLAETGR